MLVKHATRTRQSPMQKALGYGENIAKFVGGVKGAIDAGRSIYSFAQSAAPYVSAAASMLV